jgi:hypothetical protein
MCQRQRFHFGLGNDAQASTIRGPDPRGPFIPKRDRFNNEADGFHRTTGEVSEREVPFSLHPIQQTSGTEKGGRERPLCFGHDEQVGNLVPWITQRRFQALARAFCV